MLNRNLSVFILVEMKYIRFVCVCVCLGEMFVECEMVAWISDLNRDSVTIDMKFLYPPICPVYFNETHKTLQSSAGAEPSFQ